MNSYRKWIVAAVLLLAVSALGLTACGGKTASPPPRDGRLQAQNSPPGASPQNRPPSNRAVASHLETLARSVNGVQDANCVVFGRYAIVGIDVDSKMERSRVGTIKYAVARAFRKDPHGVNALVTADVDIAQRLREIRTDVRHGRPVAGFTEELADIVGRLVPEIPRNVVPTESPDNPGAPNAPARRR